MPLTRSASRLTDAFAQYSWCAAIRGLENGGRVENLPVHTFSTSQGDRVAKCPTEVQITDTREQELVNLGFIPLVHYKNSDYAVFFGVPSCHKPPKYPTKEAEEKLAWVPSSITSCRSPASPIT